MLVDAHTHLNHPKLFSDLEEVIKRVYEKEFYAVVDSSTNLEESRLSLEIAKKFDKVYSALGFHPYYSEKFSSEVIDEYRRLLDKYRTHIVAIGEIGLDIKASVDIGRQEEAFIAFLRLAKEYNLPAVIHNRGFKEKILEIIKNYGPEKIIFHCFSQDEEFMKEIVSLGYFASFSANITFKNAPLIKKAAQSAPLKNILSETDAPFLAPQIIRGKRNEPAYVEEVVKEIAALKEIKKEELESIIVGNFRRAFGNEEN